MLIPNRTELCVAALQRSGHHAIINWILANSAKPSCFLNNCRPNTNPFLSCHADESVFAEVDLDQERQGSFTRKNLIVYNYEDQALPEIHRPEFMRAKPHWVGESEKRINVLVLRDPFNNFASKYFWAINGKRWPPSREWVLKALPKLWKSYAREFLGLTNQIPAPKIFIDYNRWATRAEYRNELADLLGLESSDQGLNEVAKWGPNIWGDSFDNLDFEGRANEMRVLERWKIFQQDKAFRSIFEDQELLDLSEKIFGSIPGTPALSRTPAVSRADRIPYREEAPGVISFKMYEPGECELILQRLNSLESWQRAQVREAQNESEYQVATRSDVRSASAPYSSKAEELYREFGERIDAVAKPLIERVWQIPLVDHSGTHILKYAPGDHYVPHQDTGPTLMDRYFTLVCYLNDNFAGGQTAFPAFDYAVEPKAGKAVLFPSSYLHCSNLIVSGEKFVFVSWITGPVPIKWI